MPLVRVDERDNYLFDWVDSVGEKNYIQNVTVRSAVFGGTYGNFKIDTKLSHSLSALKKKFDTYYFIEEICVAEIEALAELVSYSLPKQVVEIELDQVRTVTARARIFKTMVGSRSLFFDGGERIRLYFFDVRSLRNDFAISPDECFPRYYLHAGHADKEEKAWSHRRIEFYQLKGLI